MGVGGVGMAGYGGMVPPMGTVAYPPVVGVAPGYAPGYGAPGYVPSYAPGYAPAYPPHF